MHEGTIAAALIANALDIMARERMETATRLTVLVGKLHHIVPTVLRQHYNLLKAQQPAMSGSRLFIRRRDVRLRCRACGKRTTLKQPAFWCPACTSPDIETVGGLELHLVSIVGETAKRGGSRRRAGAKS